MFSLLLQPVWTHNVLYASPASYLWQLFVIPTTRNRRSSNNQQVCVPSHFLCMDGKAWWIKKKQRYVASATREDATSEGILQTWQHISADISPVCHQKELNKTRRDTQATNSQPQQFIMYSVHYVVYRNWTDVNLFYYTKTRPKSVLLFPCIHRFHSASIEVSAACLQRPGSVFTVFLGFVLLIFTVSNFWCGNSQTHFL